MGKMEFPGKHLVGRELPDDAKLTPKILMNVRCGVISFSDSIKRGLRSD